VGYQHPRLVPEPTGARPSSSTSGVRTMETLRVTTGSASLCVGKKKIARFGLDLRS
jgi:hypothetical protein